MQRCEKHHQMYENTIHNDKHCNNNLAVRLADGWNQSAGWRKRDSATIQRRNKRCFPSIDALSLIETNPKYLFINSLLWLRYQKGKKSEREESKERGREGKKENSTKGKMSIDHIWTQLLLHSFNSFRGAVFCLSWPRFSNHGTSFPNAWNS